MVELKDISCGYGSKKVIHEVNFSINRGQIVSLLGANGSGKSTLLKAIVGLINYGGRIQIANKEARELSTINRAKLIAYVPQSTVIPFDFSALEVVLMGRFHASSFGFAYSKHDSDLAHDALDMVGIASFKNRVYRQLSGGERQLVLIARALAQQSQLIVMDEPITGLDLGNQMRLLELMEHLSCLGYTILQTTHYPDHALRISHKVAWLHDGLLLDFGSPKDVITRENIFNVYGVEVEFLTHENGTLHMLPLGFNSKEKG
jgi:iron complex transport system ATP-binding protein